MNEFIGIEASLASYYAVDLLIIVVILAGMRKLSGAIGNVSSHDELTQKDNHAFGISIAGAALALAIMLMGVVAGDVGMNPANEAMLMIGYGGLGLLLMWLTRKIFDHISLPNISIHKQIMQGNVAAAIVDAGNMIATAIILRAVMIWVDSNSWIGLFLVIVGFIISQILLLVATLYRRYVYARRHGGNGVQNEIENGNTALALRFSGHRIGVALAVTAASGVVIYDAESIVAHISVWAGVAVIMMTALTLIAFLTRKAVLPHVDIAEEVDRQRNVAVGSIEAAVYIAVGFLLTGLFG